MAKPVKCLRCGRDNDLSFAFCIDCGQSLKAQVASAQLPVEPVCPACGAKLIAGFKFCGNCGKPLAASIPPVLAASLARENPTLTPAILLRSVVPPQPSAAKGLRLTVMRPDGKTGSTFNLLGDESICGRSSGAVRLGEDGSVSPSHARFAMRGGKVTIEDLGSLNGTFLRLRAPRTIGFGEEIRLGNQFLRLEKLPGEPEVGTRVWGSHDPGYGARLTQLLEDGARGESYPLRKGENQIGRTEGDVTFASDGFVSGRHCKIELGDDGITLTDTGSSNGTYVKILAPVEIANGDHVLIGMQLLRVET